MIATAPHSLDSSLVALAAMVDLSIWRFATVFRQQVGVSPRRYICRRRVERAQALMC